ncbi:hypothetical protein [Xanthomonas nasturtii]|nr:hypothetical protein [Xanthomonas nasturtii]MCL1499363.1 hypothetical protein [Xanthomonas nasturtii]MCL1534935.1 hypothetical protein [Xanthomonas nasturtii]MCL1543985.1 hypothetical protein [Xanthomonas nasturtii]
MATPTEVVICTIKDASLGVANDGEVCFILPQFGPSEVLDSLEDCLAMAASRFNLVDAANRVRKAAQAFAKERELFEVPFSIFFDRTTGVQVIEFKTYTNGQLRPVGVYYKVVTNGNDVALYASSSLAAAMQVAVDEVEATIRIKIGDLKPRPRPKPRF